MKEELLFRYLYGQTTEEENKQVLVWLDADPVNHVTELNRLHYMCTAIDYYQPQPPANSSSEIPKRRSFRKVGLYIAGAAASVILLFGIWHLGNQNTYSSISNRVTTLETPAGQYLKITLEDGTNVWLNAGTKLEYPPVFEKNTRNVKLSGEALFEVQPNANRPFIVETFTSKIEVLGTTFSVFADKEYNRFSTTLVEGKVKVTNLQNPKEIFFMQPYDVVSLNGTALYKTRTKHFSDLCWRDGLIHIEKIPFDELMKKFEKAYDVKIIINREMLPEINVMRGEIRISDGIENALQILQHIADFTYVRDEKNNMIEIR